MKRSKEATLHIDWARCLRHDVMKVFARIRPCMRSCPHVRTGEKSIDLVHIVRQHLFSELQ